MSNPLKTEGSTGVDNLLRDMRDKYKHACQMAGVSDWLKGQPITVQILERWIPQVEELQRALTARENLLRELLPYAEKTKATGAEEFLRREKLTEQVRAILEGKT